MRPSLSDFDVSFAGYVRVLKASKQRSHQASLVLL